VSAPLRPIRCASWCEDGDGHTHAGLPGDQACWSPAAYLNLSLEEKLIESGGQYPQRVGVLARQSPDETPHVLVHLSDIAVPGPVPWPDNIVDHSLNLTTDEALWLADVLRSTAMAVRAPHANQGDAS
jgi:hypothetical protein